MFLIRLVQLAIALIVVGLLLVGFAWLLNRGIQWVANQFGYEVRDFFAYVKEILPKRKRRRK